MTCNFIEAVKRAWNGDRMVCSVWSPEIKAKWQLLVPSDLVPAVLCAVL